MRPRLCAAGNNVIIVHGIQHGPSDVGKAPLSTSELGDDLFPLMIRDASEYV